MSGTEIDSWWTRNKKDISILTEIGEVSSEALELACDVATVLDSDLRIFIKNRINNEYLLEGLQNIDCVSEASEWAILLIKGKYIGCVTLTED